MPLHWTRGQLKKTKHPMTSQEPHQACKRHVLVSSTHVTNLVVNPLLLQVPSVSFLWVVLRGRSLMRCRPSGTAFLKPKSYFASQRSPYFALHLPRMTPALVPLLRGTSPVGSAAMHGMLCQLELSALSPNACHQSGNDCLNQHRRGQGLFQTCSKHFRSRRSCRGPHPSSLHLSQNPPFLKVTTCGQKSPLVPWRSSLLQNPVPSLDWNGFLLSTDN